ncbi:MAG: hypothetical protein ACP5PJ_10015, partial [Acidimicrobiales bacterium]
LRKDGGLHRARDRGAVIFGVCAGFQILGRTIIERDGNELTALGIIDVSSQPLDGPRAIGEILTECNVVPGGGRLTGFENHGFGTALGSGVLPLGRVIVGRGNGCGSGEEGAVDGSIVCTYLHGPALARNPSLTEFLLSLAGVSLSSDVHDQVSVLQDALHDASVARAVRESESNGNSLMARIWKSGIRGASLPARGVDT